MQEDLRTIIREELQQLLKVNNLETELLTRRQAASFLGIKENTLAVWSVKGIGPAPSKICGCVRYQRSELEVFVSKNTMPR